MTPRASSRSRRNSQRVLRLKPENRPPVVLRPKPPNPSREAYPLRLHDLNMCHRSPRHAITKSSCEPPLNLVNRHLDLVNTVYSSTCTLACRCPQVLATHSKSSDHLDLSTQASCPSFIAPYNILGFCIIQKCELLKFLLDVVLQVVRRSKKLNPQTSYLAFQKEILKNIWKSNKPFTSVGQLQSTHV
jgi:hypothetical protein